MNQINDILYVYANTKDKIKLRKKIINSLQYINLKDANIFLLSYLLTDFFEYFFYTKLPNIDTLLKITNFRNTNLDDMNNMHVQHLLLALDIMQNKAQNYQHIRNNNIIEELIVSILKKNNKYTSTLLSIACKHDLTEIIYLCMDNKILLEKEHFRLLIDNNNKNILQISEYGGYIITQQDADYFHKKNMHDVKTSICIAIPDHYIFK